LRGFGYAHKLISIIFINNEAIATFFHQDALEYILDTRTLPPVWRIRDVYPGSRILIFTHPGSRISDPGSWIPDPKTARKERGEKKIFCHNFLCSHKFHKIAHYFSSDVLKKKFGPIFKEL
jgi:hypothetical protein